jgi:hypothetical protein
MQPAPSETGILSGPRLLTFLSRGTLAISIERNIMIFIFFSDIIGALDMRPPDGY